MVDGRYGLGALLKGLLLAFLVVVLGGAVIAGYLGFVPGLASAFGSDKPRDLGVEYIAADAKSAGEKVKAQVTALPAGAAAEKSVILSGQTPVTSNFTDKELTALIATHEAQWAYYPVSDCQVKINADGTVEAAGILRMDRAYGYAAATGVPAEVMNAVADRLKIANSNPPFYVKGTLTVTNNKVSGDVDQLEIGRLSVPANWIDDNKSQIVSFVENRIAKAGVSVKSATFANGQLSFDGTMPETVGLSPAK